MAFSKPLLLSGCRQIRLCCESDGRGWLPWEAWGESAPSSITFTAACATSERERIYPDGRIEGISNLRSFDIEGPAKPREMALP
jgi:hypothetical protein